ncbi:MAG TPA: dynamin family protein [Candidatus Limnocylindrales bacterium]|nr:dynamin family protein [Candidatus Limnocylindrales bacterium]
MNTFKSPSIELEEQRQGILELLHQIIEDLTRVYFLPGYPDYLKKMEELSEIRSRDLEGVTSILSNFNMPFIIAFAGGSSCGKSTLFNTLAGEIASLVSLLRPTTSIPVLYHHPSQTAYFNRKDFLEPYEKIVSQQVMLQVFENRVTRSSRDKQKSLPRKIILYPSQRPDYPEDFALLDTPDVDTTEAQNKEVAHDLFHIASLILFIFSTEKYADNRLWEDVQYLQSLGKPVVFVLNKLTPEHKAEGLIEDFKEHLREKGRIPKMDPTGSRSRIQGSPLEERIFYIDREQPQTENYPLQLSQKVRDEFYEFFNTFLNPAEKRKFKFQLVSRSLDHLIERLEALLAHLQEQQRELLSLESQIEKDFRLTTEAMINEIKLVGGLNNRAVINLIRENLASLIGSLNVALLKGVKTVWEWFKSIFGKEEKTLQRSRDAIEHFIEGDFDKKFNILMSHLGDVEDHVQRLIKESCIGSSLEGAGESGNVGVCRSGNTDTIFPTSPPPLLPHSHPLKPPHASDSIYTLYNQEVTQFKKWLEGEVHSKIQALREVGSVWINLMDSVILILILLLFIYIGAKGGTITGEEAAAAAGISWVWDWLVTKFWGKEELERFMVAGGERYLDIFKNVVNKRKERYIRFIQEYQKDLENINRLAAHVSLLKTKAVPFIQRLEAEKD